MRHFILAATVAALVVTSTGAFANDITSSVPTLGGTGYFGALHTDNFDFTDTFDFTDFTGSVLASASLVTIALNPAQDIDFTSAMLNGAALTLSPTGYFEMALTPSSLSLVAPLQLVVMGHSGAANGTFASYSGTLNWAPNTTAQVPEASTVVMLGLGIVVIGFMVHRRQLS